MSNTTKRNRLFNNIEIHVSPTIRRLELFCNKDDTAHAADLHQAIERLRLAIILKNDLEEPTPSKPTRGLSKEEIAQMSLLTYDEMLDVRISGLPSLKHILEHCGRFNLIETALVSCGYNRPTPAARLCQLAQVGDLNAIKACTISSYQINKLVSWAITDLSGPSTYLGIYNALMIATSYRQFHVVRYFVEEQGANLTIKGGRCRDLTAVDCANMSSWFFKAVDQQIVDYLNNCTTAYRDNLRHTFMSPSSVTSRKRFSSNHTLQSERDIVERPAEQLTL